MHTAKAKLSAKSKQHLAVGQREFFVPVRLEQKVGFLPHRHQRKRAAGGLWSYFQQQLGLFLVSAQAEHVILLLSISNLQGWKCPTRLHHPFV